VTGDPEQSRGDRSQRTALDRGSSSIDLMGVCVTISPERAEVRGERVRQPLRAAARYAPPTNMRGEGERERDTTSRPSLERNHTVLCDSTEQGASPSSRENAPSEAGRGLPCTDAKARERDWMTPPPEGADH
jgi:hypothetical protein